MEDDPPLALDRVRRVRRSPSADSGCARRRFVDVRDEAAPKTGHVGSGRRSDPPPTGDHVQLGLIDRGIGRYRHHLGGHVAAFSKQNRHQLDRVRRGCAANRNRLRSVASRLARDGVHRRISKIRGALLDELRPDWDAVVLDHVQSVGRRRLTAARPCDVVVHVSHKTRHRPPPGCVGYLDGPSARLALELDARKVAALEDRLLRTADLCHGHHVRRCRRLEARGASAGLRS